MILFHRSPIHLIQEGYIDYGWGNFDFTQYQTIDELLAGFKNKYPESNRHHNMIRRFFNLKFGDIVIVPVYKAIVLGEVIGDKRYNKDVAYGENQIKVNFFKRDGKIVKIYNSQLSTALQARLRVRQTNISLGQDFGEEIHDIVQGLKDKGFYENNKLSIQESKENELFKANLLKNIQTNKTWIKAGGRGLEELIRELFKIEGYTAEIKAKNQSSGIDDIDIVAFRDDKFFSDKLVVQVKHHQGVTDSFGVKQLNEYQDENNEVVLKKLLVTTANSVSKSAEQIANENDIRIMLGQELVEWIFENLPKLSQATKEKLGIFERYQLVE